VYVKLRSYISYHDILSVINHETHSVVYNNVIKPILIYTRHDSVYCKAI